MSRRRYDARRRLEASRTLAQPLLEQLALVVELSLDVSILPRQQRHVARIAPAMVTKAPTTIGTNAITTLSQAFTRYLCGVGVGCGAGSP